jgi:hypothetical protein
MRTIYMACLIKIIELFVRNISLACALFVIVIHDKPWFHKSWLIFIAYDLQHIISVIEVRKSKW